MQQSIGCKKQPAGMLACFILIVALAYATAVIDARDQTKVEGWTEVNKRWPLDDREYFIAVKKGHHFIRVNLPDESETDLNVKLEYYYSYSRVRPTIQMVRACNENLDVITPDETVYPQGKWLEHRAEVKRTGCDQRQTVEYNVLLHDPNDVFAWRLIELKSQPRPAATTTESPAAASAAETTTTIAPRAADEVVTTTKKPDYVQWTGLADKPKEADEAQQEEKKESPDYVQWSKDHLPIGRYRRAADSTEPAPATSQEFEAVCKPSSCNTEQFDISKPFLRLAKALPKLKNKKALDEGHQFYLSTDTRPLTVKTQTDQDLSESDPCIELQLYMDAGTKLDMVVTESENGKTRERLLETIERFPGDSTAGRWDAFKRCVSNYMPKLNPSDPSKHSMSWIFKPNHDGVNQQVAMLMEPKTMAPLRKLYAPHEFLPNLQNYASASQLRDFWVVDNDGIKKPRLDFWAPGESSSAGAAKKRALRIRDIDPRQESFDLTSRWIKVRDTEILKNPLFMMYRISKEPWIKSIQFQYQSAESSDWVSQTVYETATPAATTTTANPTTLAVTGTGELTTVASASGPAPNNKRVKRASSSGDDQQILLPIKVVGLSKDEFRFRLRHFVDHEERPVVMGGHSLSINTLAFGDACAESSYCLNGASCKPLSAADAQCTCLPGYSGAHCQVVRPCEVIYEGRTGKDLCESVGAECVKELPVFRCRWPNDQYFKCQSLYNGNATDSAPIPAASTDESGDESTLSGQQQLDRLKEKAVNQEKLIIIMAVFMVAMTLFAVVIVANMVSRLMKTKRRLKRAQGDAVELARRSAPSTSSAPTGLGGRPSLGGRYKSSAPAAPISYSNQSFDAE